MVLFYFFTALLLVILFIVLYQYFFVRKDLIVLKAESEAEKKVLLGRIDGFVSENAIRKEENVTLTERNNELISLTSSLKTENENYKKLVDEFKIEKKKKKQKIESLLKMNMESSSSVSRLETENANYKKRIEEIKNESEEMKNKLTVQFQNLANNILEENSKKFVLQNRENIDSLLKPLSERIRNFKEQLDISNKNANEQNVSLRLELQKTILLGNKMSQEAENLTKAIKGNTKIQGNWGENILEKILENSGLEKDRDYIIQASFRTDEGKLYMPDVIINLPGEKHIIVDSKMSLNNYEQYFNAEDEQEKEKQLKLHFDSVKKHVVELAEKKYQSEYDVTGLDFVLMFIPIEQAYSLIIQSNQSIFEEAYNKNVVITSPSTLIPTLRIIANIWKKEKQNQNAMLIAQQAGALYDKFVGFVEDLKSIGKQIDNTRNVYADAMKKLCEGKGNLVTRAENIKLLGAKVSKTLGSEIVISAES